LLAAQLLRPKPINVIVQGGHATVGGTAPDFTTQTLDGAAAVSYTHLTLPTICSV